MRVLVIDPRTSGVACDALLGAMVDLLGGDDDLVPVADAVRTLGACRDLSYTVREADVGGIAALQLDLRIDAKSLSGGPALRDAAEAVAREAELSETGTETALRALDDLLSVEARLQRAGTGHPSASLDTLFEIVGTVRLLEAGGFPAGEVYGLLPALGTGVAATGSAPIALPEPATIEILGRHRVPFRSLPTDAVLTTPTGAALFANLAARMTEVFPAMTPIRAGYGAAREGSAVLRVVEGTCVRAVADRIVMLETNLDDVPGEVIGYTIERLRAAGAVDVFVTPAYGKKNRPVSVLHVISGPSEYDELLAILMEESGTLGVRVLDQPRLVAERNREVRRVTVGERPFEVRVKTSTVEGRTISVKPEYEDLRRIALELGRPLRSVDEEVRAQLRGWEAP